MEICEENAAREGGRPPGLEQRATLLERFRRAGDDINDTAQRHMIFRGAEIPRVYIESDDTRRQILLHAEQICRVAGYEFLHPKMTRDYRLPPQPKGRVDTIPEALQVLIDHGYEVRRGRR